MSQFWAYRPGDPYESFKVDFIDAVNEADARDRMQRFLVLRRGVRRAGVPFLGPLCLRGVVRACRELGNAARTLRHARRLVIDDPSAPNFQELGEAEHACGNSEAARGAFLLAARLAEQTGNTEEIEAALCAIAALPGVG
ncbi:MAG: hypothetical protein HOO96_11520 [Polyangiaceae bacterium]|nr:hypothetical protein [Polyangiaceae bacterium]